MLIADDNGITTAVFDAEQLKVIAVVLTIWLLILLATLWAVLKAAVLPPPVTLIVVLTALTLVSMASFIVTRQQELLALAGTGFGALAGAVATVWGRPHEDEKSHVHLTDKSAVKDLGEEPDGEQP